MGRVSMSELGTYAPSAFAGANWCTESQIALSVNTSRHIATYQCSKSALAIYHLSRKVIARQLAKITWPQSQLYERNSENGREYLCASRVWPIQRWQVAQVIGNAFAVPIKGLTSSSVAQNL